MNTKKLFLLLYVFFISLTLIISVQGAEASNEYNVKINGQPVQFTMAPLIDNGNLLLPLREIYEIFGFDVQWDAVNRRASCIKAGKKVLISVGSKTAQINDEILTLSAPSLIISGRIYVASEAICQGLNVNVNLKEEEKTVYFTSENGASVSVSGENNFLVAGNNVIVSVVRRYNKGNYKDEIEAADNLLENYNYWGSIKSYEQILKNISSEKNPEEYAHTMNNMANAYLSLSCLINKDENALKAISIFEEVLANIKDEKYSSYIAGAYKGIGRPILFMQMLGIWKSIPPRPWLQWMKP
ncbi:stalk domain-containing protein [Acetivibrio straminisolvens]|uniref:Copper amine oxidase-like N-terminal domain-containing protein n=1 Tax=Acetivibrio straminisolvens JCM 21531 TaxID=1294263 RepID=W4V517_9FIRM|nr:stalk domain-containing protein [Acetivibrio straminisolvens]GAE88262.1 hypothetical protein JCM21531_1694 [Acetivibrio straminisolvens JCM 21531]